MKNNIIEKVINQVFTEKSILDFYSEKNTCAGWERNVIDQPETVKKIVDLGAERVSAGTGIGKELSDIAMARIIDHTLLKPETTTKEVETLCAEAKQHHFASVCINPAFVALCKNLLRNTDVKVCTVIGFPLGANTTEVKRFEAEQAINNGADEIDMVINISKLKDGDYDYVFNDINQVVLAAKRKNVVCKVILETALLTDEEKVKACLISKSAKADFVKTSTGFSKGGATVADVMLMKYVVGSSVGVKASGGIRNTEDAEAMVAGGADRIGASASVKIVSGSGSSAGGY